MTKSLILKTGLLHPDLEQGLLNDLKLIKESDPFEPIVVLIGSNLLREYLNWRLIASGFDLFNVRFVTFANLTDDLSITERLTDSRPDLPLNGELACTILAAESHTKPRYFQKVYDRPGFLRALTQTFVDLDEANIEYIDKATGYDHTGKLTTLAHLRHEYIKQINHFRHSHDDLRPLIDPLSLFQQVYQTDRLFIYGFYDFNALQRQFISSLDGKIELRIFLPYLEGKDYGNAFRYADNTYNFFADDAVNRGGLTAREQPEGWTLNSRCQGFGNHLFRFQPEEMGSPYAPSNRSLSVFTASNPTDEIRGIVNRINELVLWEDVPLSRVGVLLWKPEIYLESLKYELDRAGLPFCNAIGEPLDKTIEGKAFISLLNMTGKPLERKALMDLIAVSALRLDSTDNPESEEPSDPVAWEAISIETGILEGNRERWLNELNFLETAIREKESFSKWKHHLITVNQVRLFHCFIDKLFNLLEKPSNKDTWTGYTDWVVTFIENMLPDNDNTEKLKNAVSGLRDLDELTERIELKRFITDVGSRLGEIRLKQGRYGVDGLTISDKMSSRGLSYDLLFIPGLAQGMIPTPPREDPILNDYDRQQINKVFSNTGSATAKLPEPLPLKSKRLDEEKLLFALAVDSAEKQLILSYPQRRTDGKDTFPSRFLLDMCRIVSGSLVESDKLDELDFYEDDIKSPDNDKLKRRFTDPLRFPIEWVKANVPAEEGDHVIRELYTGRSERYTRCMDVTKHRRTGNRFTEWDGVLPEGWDSRGVISNRHSVTSLEDFSGCPFLYYIKHILKAKRWEEPKLAIEPPAIAIGEVIHAVLERFYTQTQDSGWLPLKDDDLDNVKTAIKDILADEMKRIKNKYPIPRVLWELENKRLEERLLRFIIEDIKRSDGYNFDKAEVEIDQILTFETDEEEYRVHLSGKIDRIDLSDDNRSIRIIDYKTGQARSKANQFSGGKSLQLPIYLKSILDSNPDADLQSSIAEYLHIKQDGSIRSIPFEGQQLIERSEDLGRLVKIITESIKTGTFPPIPDNNICRTCDAQYLCDFRSRKSVEDDPRVAGILEGREIE
ncbi:MAG: PD-(D/E)XK nuclease family protein [Candidatus Hatepunaea meridiana]|nr:PD-(D/E)XK nuclease family protein [Candidatus Hatepunaea meridiana]